MRKKLYCILGILAVLMVAALVGRLLATHHYNKEEIGVNTVKLLYEFSSYEDLARHQVDLQECTTSEVYNQLTFDKEERTLFTYLKFKNKQTAVRVIKSTDDYVLYSLDNENIDASRKFIFLFEVDKQGKVCSVREEECIDFVDYLKTSY